MAAEGMQFPWRRNGGTISLNLDVIWDMSVKRAFEKIKNVFRGILPGSIWKLLQVIKKFILDFPSIFHFLFTPDIEISLYQRIRYIWRILVVDMFVECPHQNSEILAFSRIIFKDGPSHEGVFIEAGCFKGGSAAKFSVACAAVDRRLVVCDSFQGIPQHDEPHSENIFGGKVSFAEGSYAGSISEVKANIEKYGRLEICDFVVGYFADSLPDFRAPIIGAYLDVDLALSTAYEARRRAGSSAEVHPSLPPNGASPTVGLE